MKKLDPEERKRRELASKKKWREKNKSIQSEKFKDRWKNDPEFRERMLKNQKKWNKANRDKVREYGRKHDREKRPLKIKADLRTHLLRVAKVRSKRNGTLCDLEIEDIIIPEYCPYLGTKITMDLGRGKVRTNASIDRIQNSKDYVKGNVQVISTFANYLKRDASIEQLITFAKNVLKIHG